VFVSDVRRSVFERVCFYNDKTQRFVFVSDLDLPNASGTFGKGRNDAPNPIYL